MLNVNVWLSSNATFMKGILLHLQRGRPGSTARALLPVATEQWPGSVTVLPGIPRTVQESSDKLWTAKNLRAQVRLKNKTYVSGSLTQIRKRQRSTVFKKERKSVHYFLSGYSITHIRHHGHYLLSSVIKSRCVNLEMYFVLDLDVKSIRNSSIFYKKICLSNLAKVLQLC